MITGVVTADLQAIIRLSVWHATGQPQDIDAVIDTGFTGFLTLPPALIAALGLPWLSRQQALLADGSVHPFDVYAVTVLWDGQPRTVEVDAADTDPLVGMSLLKDHALWIHVVTGGAVTVGTAP